MSTTLACPPAAQPVQIDVRGLEPPEPMQHVLGALAQLPPHTPLAVRIHREPLFLYQIIEPDGWCHSSHRLGPDDWEICIWRLEDER
jgi:hypothetical protein